MDAECALAGLPIDRNQKPGLDPCANVRAKANLAQRVIVDEAWNAEVILVVSSAIGISRIAGKVLSAKRCGSPGAAWIVTVAKL
jgi:hypothetical protein